MPSTIICPNCRRPQEESGRLTCPDCSAMLPASQPVASNGNQSRPAAASASALDEFIIPQRPTGAMTLLRNDLRSEDKAKQQTGWLDNIITKKPKDGNDPDAAPSARAIRESFKAPQHLDEANHELKPKSQPKAAPAPSPAHFEHSEPAFAHAQHSFGGHPAPENKQDLTIGLVVGVLFTLFAATAALQGKAGLLGTVVLLTAGLIGASLLGSWYREAGRKAFFQGFAVFGLVYLVLAFVPTFAADGGLELPTARLFRIVHAKATGTAEDPRNSVEIMKSAPAKVEVADASAPAPQTASFFTAGDVRQFTVVGHCYFAILFALAGSALATWLHKSSLPA